MQDSIGLKSQISRFIADKKAFIFDLDGVLVDTARFHYQAWKKLANTLGFDFTLQRNEQLKGVSRMQSLEYVLGWGGIQRSMEEKNRLANQKNDWYLEMVGDMTHWDVLPGVFQFLEYAQGKRIKIGLGSASKNAKFILERTGILHFFDAVIDGNAVTESKPHPEVFSKAAESLGVKPEDSLVFEDAQTGIEAAIAAGMQVIGIGRETDLQGADLVVNGLVDLVTERRRR